MIDPHVPLVVATVLAGLLVVVLAVLIAHAAWQRARGSRLEQPLADACSAVARTVDGHAEAREAVAVLTALPVTCRITVLADLAPTLRGVQRERLEELVRATGLSESAARCARSRRWWRRLHAARLATLLGGGEGVLEPLLHDRSWEVRAEAAGWAADHPSQPTIERLLELLDDPEPLPRFAAKDALRRIGRPMAEPLQNLLADAHGAQAASGLEVAVAVANPGLVAPALRLGADPLPRTRIAAARLLGTLGGEAAVEALRRMLDDTDPDVRACAAHALGQLGHWPAAASLSAHLRDPAWDVRRSSALALRRLGSPGLLLLRRALANDDRYAADIAQQVLDLPDAAEEALPA